jgi:nitroreductase/NAD-dependent dihydropyrimidine dehydrogenase PreA subunit
MEEQRELALRIKRDLLFGHDIAPPTVDTDKCTGCGLCVRVCSAYVLEVRDKKAVVARGEGCFACGHCWAVCPEEAVFHGEASTATSLRPGPAPAVSPDALQLLIRERRSTRLFKDKPVSREQLLQIVEAGRYGPTAGNRQNVHYTVLSNQERVSELRSLLESYLERVFGLVQNRASAFLVAMRAGRKGVDLMRYYGAGYPLLKGNKEVPAYFVLPFGMAVLVVHGPSRDATAAFNCAVALYNGALMAHSLGLGSCFLGFVQLGANGDQRIKQWLEIPKENECYGAMVVGYPDVRYRRLVERKAPDITWR